MLRVLRFLLHLLLVVLLTILTQVGGIVYAISLLGHGYIRRKFLHRWQRILAQGLSFSALYLLFALFLVPAIAKPLGRVPLPLTATRYVKPAHLWTCLLNRHYVKPELREITFAVAEEMQKKYPGTFVKYLDANFPFIDKFPLPPHLSHIDGKKLDLSFQYRDHKTGEISPGVPSWLGYGICEEPRPGEENRPEACAEKGYWQYNLLRRIIPQGSKKRYLFDEAGTRAMVQAFVSKNGVRRILIEPHLKARLGLTSAKVRFHGCQAVRHDDHIHVELL
ncbi:MAG: hypothetical protein EAZ89_12890 [Bacteroidetes bacterium]|nr:MAG: hypothetical protein EAZ89_12890 [Bacteroidota bacterium]